MNGEIFRDFLNAFLENFRKYFWKNFFLQAFMDFLHGRQSELGFNSCRLASTLAKIFFSKFLHSKSAPTPLPPPECQLRLGNFTTQIIKTKIMSQSQESSKKIFFSLKKEENTFWARFNFLSAR